jgi:hypothetical protein
MPKARCCNGPARLTTAGEEVENHDRIAPSERRTCPGAETNVRAPRSIRTGLQHAHVVDRHQRGLGGAGRVTSAVTTNVHRV